MQQTSKNKLDFLTMILSAVAGIAWMFVGSILLRSLQGLLWTPLMIGLYFLGLVFVLILTAFLCTKIKGYSLPENNAYGKAFLLALAIFVLSGLFQWIYSASFRMPTSKPTSYIFLIDDSSSIYDPTNLREKAVKDVMAGCDEDFPFAVYGFTHECWQIQDMKPAKKATETPFNLNGGGGTDIILALETVLDDIDRGALNGGASPRIVLLTDGLFGKATKLRGLLGEAVDKHVSISTVGMAGSDEDLLKRIAEETGGGHMMIDDISDLTNAMHDVVEHNTGYVRTLMTSREPLANDWLYSAMRIIFLLILGALFIFIKSLLLRTNATGQNLLVPNLVLVLIGALCIEVGMNIFFLPEKWMQLVMCIGFTILFTVEAQAVLNSGDEYYVGGGDPYAGSYDNSYGGNSYGNDSYGNDSYSDYSGQQDYNQY